MAIGKFALNCRGGTHNHHFGECVVVQWLGELVFLPQVVASTALTLEFLSETVFNHIS